MKLTHSPNSPYVRKVMIVLQETGQTDAVELVNGQGSPLEPNMTSVAMNPLGKIPALERADGPTLFDSRVICRFLDARAGGKLYPGGNRLWEVLTLEALADGILDAAVSMTYEARQRPQAKQMPEWVDAQWAKIARACDAINGRWMSHLAGPLDMGQIAVACALGYIDFRHGGRNWRKGNDALNAWFETFSARDSFKSTQPSAG